MKLYTDKKVVLGFIAALMILLCLGYFSYRNNQKFIETRALVFHTTKVLHHIEQTQTNAIRTEEMLAKYIISRDSTFLLQYANEINHAAEHYSNLKELTADNARQQIMIDSFRSIGSKKLLLHQQIIEAVKADASNAGDIINSKENVASTQQVNDIISSMRDEENNLLAERIKISIQSIENFQITFLGLMLVIMLLLISVFFVINSSFKARLIADEKTKQVNLELEAFTYSVSHDLRAPLRSIRGFTEVLREEFGSKLDQEGIRLLNIVMKNASRMGQLIDDMLDFSRLERKNITYSKIPVRETINEIIQELMVHEQRDVTWDIKPMEDIRGDIGMIKQVWTNLISNALKYTKTKTMSIIEIGSYQLEGNTVFYIRDNGVGFDMKYSNKLFKVFQRLHNNNEFEGTGVGLALVHRVISKHNGKIWADAKQQEGATFSFYLNNPTL